MRHYLVHAIGASPQTGLTPFNGVIHLEDHEVFDAATVITSQNLLSEQNGGVEVKIMGFQLLESRDGTLTCTAASGLQLNDCGTVLPPVDSPLLIQIAEDVPLLRAYRPVYAEHKGDQLEFNLEGGGKFIGRPLWTHP